MLQDSDPTWPAEQYCRMQRMSRVSLSCRQEAYLRISLRSMQTVVFREKCLALPDCWENRNLIIAKSLY